MTPEAWDTLVSDYLESTFTARPDIAVFAGRHEHDGRLPDWSETGLEAERARLEEWRMRIGRSDTNMLDTARRFERDYVLSQIDGDLFWLERAEWPRRSPAWYAGGLDPDVYVTRKYAPLEQRMRAYITYARNVPAATQQIRASLRPPFPRTYIDRGRGAFGGLASFLAEDVPRVFSPVQDSALQAEFRDANAGAVAALSEVDTWLESLRSTQTEDFAIGEALFREMLWMTERVDTPLGELARIARADLDRNLAALRDVCERYAPGVPVAECVRRVDAKKPVDSPVAEARRQIAELRTFVESRQLVTIPGPEQALVDESPPHMRWNSAYISIPGPYEKNLPATYYIAPPDSSWSEEERAQYVPGKADLLAVSVHEVWPGHFLQFLHSNRAASRFGQVFVGYAFAEGWAHYAEELMIEAGLADADPEIRIGQLMNALLRNVRFVTAIGLHTQGMSVDDAERIFREEGFQDVGNARQQAARGTFDPGYLNYTLGKLMVLKLRADWTATRGGGRAGWRAFHDALLSYGGPPIPLLRAAMLGESATASLF